MTSPATPGQGRWNPMAQSYEAEPTLAEFLLARIAEDEAAAEKAARGVWRYEERGAPDFPGMGDIASESETAEQYSVAHDNDREAGYGACDREDAEHIVRWQPARVLAECEAKRRIVEIPLSWPSKIRQEYRAWTWLPAATSPAIIEQWARDEEGELDRVVRRWSRSEYESVVVERIESPVLRLLALPYADHPDFQESWRV